MTLTPMSKEALIRLMVAQAYGDLTPFLDARGYLTGLAGDLPASATMQIKAMRFVKTATGDRIKPTVVSPAVKRKLVREIEQLEHHSDPAVRQVEREERERVLADYEPKTTT